MAQWREISRSGFRSQTLFQLVHKRFVLQCIYKVFVVPQGRQHSHTILEKAYKSTKNCFQKPKKIGTIFWTLSNLKFQPLPLLLYCSLSLPQLRLLAGPGECSWIFQIEEKWFPSISFFVTCKPSLPIAARIAAGAQMSHFLIRVTCTYASWFPWKAQRCHRRQFMPDNCQSISGNCLAETSLCKAQRCHQPKPLAIGN